VRIAEKVFKVRGQGHVYRCVNATTAEAYTSTVLPRRSVAAKCLRVSFCSGLSVVPTVNLMVNMSMRLFSAYWFDWGCGANWLLVPRRDV